MKLNERFFVRCRHGVSIIYSGFMAYSTRNDVDVAVILTYLIGGIFAIHAFFGIIECMVDDLNENDKKNKE